MKHTSIITIIGMAVLLTSCAKEVSEKDGLRVVNPNPPERRVEFLSFKASLQDRYKTKTAIDLDITHKVIWEKDDAVLIEDDLGHKAIYKAVSGGRDTTTLVRESGDTLATGSSYKAWYPATFKDEGLPSTVYYDEAGTLREAPMYAEGSGKLDFIAQCGVVRFSYNPTATSVIVKKLVFSAKEQLTTKGDGKIVMDITTNYPNGRTLYATSRNEFSICLMPGSYTELNAVLLNGKDELDNVTLEYTLNVTAGVITDVDLNNPEGRVVNLSKYGTANCYAVTHAGEYFFVPTKGCSSAAVDGIEKVEIIWETDNNTVLPASSSITDLKYEDGNIMFVVPEDYKPSNVLIGAKNAAGDILWSWHLWVCENSIGVQQYDNAGNMMLMDRCLGALTVPVSKGTGPKYAALLYQWGRKDPFPGCTVNGTSGLRPMSAVNWLAVKDDTMDPQDRFIEAGPVSIGTTLANPYVFYKNAADWLETPSDTLWAADHKTIFDPCPVGYMIPPMSAYYDVNGQFYKGRTLSNSSGMYAGKNTVNNEYYAFPFTNIMPGAKGMPEAGGSTKHQVWVTDLSATSQPYGMQMTYVSPAGALTEPAPVFLKSDAIGIRCMYINQ